MPDAIPAIKAMRAILTGLKRCLNSVSETSETLTVSPGYVSVPPHTRGPDAGDCHRWRSPPTCRPWTSHPRQPARFYHDRRHRQEAPAGQEPEFSTSAPMPGGPPSPAPRRPDLALSAPDAVFTVVKLRVCFRELAQLMKDRTVSTVKAIIGTVNSLAQTRHSLRVALSSFF